MADINTRFVSLEQTKLKFFNREMRKQIGRAKSDALSMGGAFIRRSARSSMKKAPKRPKTLYGQRGVFKKGKKKGKSYFRRGRYSPAGGPPHYLDNRPNMRTILFAYDSTDSLIVGPILLPNRRRQSRTAPNTHEQGGTLTFFRKRSTARTATSVVPRSRTIRANYPKRPFMFPAGKKGAEQLPNSVKQSFRRHIKGGRL